MIKLTDEQFKHLLYIINNSCRDIECSDCCLVKRKDKKDNCLFSDITKDSTSDIQILAKEYFLDTYIWKKNETEK